jgi:nicotinamide-nucleotide amidase
MTQHFSPRSGLHDPFSDDSKKVQTRDATGCDPLELVEAQLPVYPKILELRDALQQADLRLILAESCTAGGVAAELGQIPGISNSLCGSMVIYRNETKAQWLNIPRPWLDDPSLGPVSDRVTRALAQSVLEHTPEATVGAAITGHLGPGAPSGLDGSLYCAAVHRDQPESMFSQHFRLIAPPPEGPQDLIRRQARQREAIDIMIDFLIRFVKHDSPDPQGTTHHR